MINKFKIFFKFILNKNTFHIFFNKTSFDDTFYDELWIQLIFYCIKLNSK